MKRLTKTLKKAVYILSLAGLLLHKIGAPIEPELLQALYRRLAPRGAATAPALDDAAR